MEVKLVVPAMGCCFRCVDVELAGVTSLAKTQVAQAVETDEFRCGNIGFFHRLYDLHILETLLYCIMYYRESRLMNESYQALKTKMLTTSAFQSNGLT